ncbi:MAG: amidohydrolase family protein [Alphaproteobacteria bacterium]|jgi:imidazolonepropionase-like amidohydrolase|nr:amidohydrolase family protein [Alphaproteobacteria bacterium]
MSLAIVGGRLIDGTGRDPVEDGVVVIVEGRIAAAGAASAVALPTDATRIDAGGGTILPGFVDCHLHCSYRARDYGQHLKNPATYNVFRSAEILRRTLHCGITTARDTGGADAGFRQAVAEDIVAGPRLQVAIAMISQSGGHGDCFVPAGFHVPKRGWLPNNIADGVDGMRRVCREFLMRGADFLKICTTGGVTSVTDDYDETQFSLDEIRVAVAEAAAKGTYVAVHAEGRQGVKNALAGGIRSLEHGWFLDEECVDQMLSQGTWWVPTLALVPEGAKHRRQDRAWAAQQLADEDSKEARIMAGLERQIPLFKEAVRRGVKVAMGTDQSHRLLTGRNLIELAYMVDYLGMTAMEAIVAGTATAARFLGYPDLGTLEAGKIADVVVYDGDPLDDIRGLAEARRVRLVMKDGRVYKDTLQDT